MKVPPTPSSLPPATLQILISLADRERHGYAILRDIADRTADAFPIGPATLYTSIKRMLAAGWIEPCEAVNRASADPRRRLYRLTAVGRAVALQEIRRLERVVAQGRRRLPVARSHA